MDKPLYPHTCTRCQFLGSFMSTYVYGKDYEESWHDLYYCSAHGTSGNTGLVVRKGPSILEYGLFRATSFYELKDLDQGDGIVYNHSFLEAYRRAVKHGFIDETEV